MTKLITFGWREWFALPELNIDRVKCKIDTGARTSAIHAFSIEPDQASNRVQFCVHPVQRNNKNVVVCEAAILDQRKVTDSGGHPEMRYVIETLLSVGSHQWPIELTLTNRDAMKFRMLLGRTAMRDRCLVNPGASYLFGRPGKKSGKRRR